jgi:DNA-binding transcriptional MerR regulator
MKTPLTIGAVADRFGVAAWQVRRLFERGILPPADRVGMYRVVSLADLPRIESALRQAGYLGTKSTPSLRPTALQPEEVARA